MARRPRRKPAPRKASPRKPVARAKAARPKGQLARRRSAPASPAILADLKTVATARQVFWSNVLREIMVSLCVASMKINQRAAATPPAPIPEGQADPARIFDGRLAVITSWGLRLPIASIEPVLGAGPAHGATAMSLAVECSVFQIRTTDGDVWTLPLHEVRAFHALTEELMQELAKAAADEEGEQSPDAQPFGFKAFTSLSRVQTPPAADPHQPDYLGE